MTNQVQRYLGVYGPKASGKTVYLTSLYNSIHSREDGASFRISSPEGEGNLTNAYLTQRWQQITKQRKWADATELSEPTKLLFRIAWQDDNQNARNYQVILPDACGELMLRSEEYAATERSSILQQKLKDDYLKELQKSDGIAIFVPGNLRIGSPQTTLKHAFDPLFDAIKRGSKKQPVAVIVTMWDLHSPNPESLAIEEAKARRYIREVLGSFVEDIEQDVPNFVRVFPLSATGPLFDENESNHPITSFERFFLPPAHPKPFFLKSPIQWLLSSYDQMLLLQAERKSQEIQKNKPTVKQLRSLEKDLQQNLIEVPPSEQRKKLLDILNDLKDNIRNRQHSNFIRNFLVILIVLVGFLFVPAVILTFQDWKTAETADIESKEIAQNLQITPEERLSKIEQICQNRLLVRFLGCWKKVKEQKQRMLEKDASKEWKTLESIPKEISTERLEERKHSIQRFLKHYPSANETTLAKGKLSEIEERLLRYKKEQQKQQWNMFVRRVKKDREPQEIIELEKECRSRFLAQQNYAWMLSQIQEKCEQLKNYRRSALDAIAQKKREQQKKQWNTFLQHSKKARHIAEIDAYTKNCRLLFLEKQEYRWIHQEIHHECEGLRLRHQEAKVQATNDEREKRKREWEDFQEKALKATALDEIASYEQTCRSNFLEKPEFAWINSQMNLTCDKLRSRIKQGKESEDIEQSFSRLKLQLARNDDSNYCVQQVDTFLIKHPKARQIPDAKQMKLECEQKIDNANWEKVEVYAKKKAQKYSNIIDRVEKYLKESKHKANASKANELLDETRKKWDRHLYEKIQSKWKEIRANLSYEQIEEMKTLCTSYINDAPTKRMREHAKNWLGWYKKLLSGIQVYVEIKGISIGKNWTRSFIGFSPNIVVHIKVGETEKQSKELVRVTAEIMHRKGGDLKLPQTLGPFSWKYAADDIAIRIVNKSTNKSVSKHFFASKQYNITCLDEELEIEKGYKLDLELDIRSKEDQTPNITIFPEYND